MGGESNGGRHVGGREFLSLTWLIALVAAFCVVVPVAGAAAEEVGGALGMGIWFAAWGAMVVVAWVVAYRYANPSLPTLCGVMIGATAPRPSEAWVRELLGDGPGRAANFSLSILAIALGMAVFAAIAKRHQAPTGG